MMRRRWIACLLPGVAAVFLASSSASAPTGVTTASRLPVADAGPDLSARVSVPVTIDGSNSHGRSRSPDRRPVVVRIGASDDSRGPGESDGELIAFGWTIAQAPPGSAAGIEASSPAPVFVPDVPGAYVLQLVVTDAKGFQSLPDQMALMAFEGDAPPNALAGKERTVRVGAPVDLDGNRSFDPEGVPVTFLWSLVSAPEGSRLTDSDLSFVDTATPRFTPDVAGTYELQLQVSDGESAGEVRVRVGAVARNLPPVADAGPDQRLRNVQAVHLSGAASSDPDAGPSALGFFWSLVTRPAGSHLTSASLRGADTVTPEFTPDVEGIYIWRLEVTDGRKGDGDNVLILFKANRPPHADSDAAATGVFTPVDIDVLANDSDSDGDALSVLAVGQGSQGSVSINTNGTVRYRPNLGASGTDSFQYSVGDGHGGSDSATVVVTISTLGPPIVDSFSPPSGRIGDVVTLTGSSLADTVGVRFAGKPAEFTIESSTRVTAVVPGGATSGPIAVFSPGGVFTTAEPFVLVATSDFALSVLPDSLTLRAGEEGAFSVTLESRGVFASVALLSVRGLPSGATAKFTAPKLVAGHSTLLKIEAGPTTPDGIYPLLVTASVPGSGGPITHSASISLQVLGAPVGGPAVSCGSANISGLTSTVLVSPQGKDAAGCGQSAAGACASISQGIANCGASGCGVLVRYGRYPTSATIALRNGVSVYGGCVFGTGANPNYRTVIEASPAPGTPAISADSISTPTTVHGLDVIGKDETATGTASIAMAVTASKGLTLVDSTLAAGKGGDGAAGGSSPGAQGGNGQSGNGSGGSGGGGAPSCPSNHTTPAGGGGNGGDGLQGGLAFPNFCFITCPCGYPNVDASVGRGGGGSGAVPGGGGGGRSYGGSYCTGPAGDGDFNGKNGGPGLAGPCGTQGGSASPLIWGKPQGASWLPGAGITGETGSVGSGGGGGSSGGYCVGFPNGWNPAFVNGYAGGGGGGGGCGGNGGSGGQQGGASISLMLVNSTVAGIPNQNSLIPGPGGSGGQGGPGSQGGPGGSGGPAHPAGPTQVGGYLCPAVSGAGGPGGQGGAGAGGSGGNGGPSIGVALVSGSPDPGRPGIYAGLPGAPGAKGPGGENAPQPPVQPNPCKAADGADGVQGGTSPVVNLDNPVNNILTAGQSLAVGESRTSAAGVELIMQGDLNFCLYKPPGVPLWCTNTTRDDGGTTVIMQTDGNLCLYPPGAAAIFCSGTAGHPGAYLVVQDDGHAVIYYGPTAIWSVP